MFEKFWNKLNRCTKTLSNVPVLLTHACLSIKKIGNNNNNNNNNNNDNNELR